jgi:hypothetical protein
MMMMIRLGSFLQKNIKWRNRLLHTENTLMSRETKNYNLKWKQHVNRARNKRTPKEQWDMGILGNG